MRRSRARGLVGLLLGLSGCAGVTEYRVPGPTVCEVRTPMTVEAPSGSGPAQAARSESPPTRSSTRTAGAMPQRSTLAVARYFPSFEERGVIAPQPREPARLDPLGIHSLHTFEPRPLMPSRKPVRVTAADDPGGVTTPASDPSPSGSNAPVKRHEPDPARQGPKPVWRIRWPKLPSRAEPSTGGDMDTSKVIPLEVETDSGRAGKPRWPGTPRRPHPSPEEAVQPKSDLTFPAAYYRTSQAERHVPTPGETHPPALPRRRVSMATRLYQRLRERLDDPGSTGGEAHDVAQLGQGGQVVAAKRLDKPAQR